jgi:DNA repair protein RadC
MQTIKNFELKVKRVAVGEGSEPYGASVRSPSDVARIAQALIGDSAQEHFCVFLLDVKNRVVGFTQAAMGAIDSCPVDPRSVFRAAVATGASAIVVTHNHPSGDLRPSAEDLHLTQRLKAAGDLLGIALLDHVLVTDTGTTSLRERGQL